MWTITRLRLKQDRRGVSNIIVVVLSLVIIVVIISNIVLCGLDWAKMKEDMNITNVERVTPSSWFVAQSEYTVNQGSLVSGTYQDTQTANNVNETFQESLPSSQLETLRPNAAGQYKQWPSEFPAASAYWSLCDEDPPDDDDTYVENADVTLWLYVNADDEMRTDWTRVGINPYLDAIGYNTNKRVVNCFNRGYLHLFIKIGSGCLLG